MTTPSLPTFANGTVPSAADLNALGAHINQLYAQLQAGFRVRRPMIGLRITRENHEIPSNTDRQVIWDVADVDTDHMWSGVTSEQITVNTSGIYLAGFQPTLVASGAAAGAVLAARIAWEPSALAQPNPTWAPAGAIAGDFAPVQAGTGAAALAMAPLHLVAGDRLRCLVTHNAGQTIALDPSFGGTRFFAIWVDSLIPPS